MDLVYPLRASDDNEALRYSLRSAARNLPHDRVWVVGHKPKWLTGVEYLAVNQYGSKWENSTANMMTACLQDDVSPSFVYMNDDFFVLRPVAEVEPLNRGRMADVLPYYRYARGGYATGMRETLTRLRALGYAEPLSYELHLPMVIERAPMVEALRLGLSHSHKRTVYGNLVGYGGRVVEDVKVHSPQGRLIAGSDYLSTSPQSWSGTLGKRLRAAFPDPSPYERS